MDVISTSIILGAIATSLVQFVKKVFGTKGYATLGVVAVTSLALAAGYQYLESSPFMPVFVQTLAYGGAIYVYFIKRF